MKYWWVNHNQTFKQEIHGGYIWSPLRKKDGKFNQTYLNLTLTNIGDIVFSYAEMLIQYIGVVTANSQSAVVPKEFGMKGDQWDKNGNLVKIKWTKLQHPFKPKEFINQLEKLLPSKFSPIQRNGNGNQGVYLARIDEDLGERLIILISTKNGAVGSFLENKPKIFGEYPLLEADQASNLNEDAEEYKSSGEDEREKVKREIKARRGQKKFRDDLRKRFANKCVVTGCEILDILEAAHINPYRGNNDNHPSNGLLLRSDIHTLFDLDLIGIEPHTFHIYIPERIKRDYGHFHLQKLLVKGNALPDKTALEVRWSAFISKQEKD